MIGSNPMWARTSWPPGYHWHGLQPLFGDGFVLGGMGLLVILVVLARVAPPPRSATAAPEAIAQIEHAAAPAKPARGIGRRERQFPSSFPPALPDPVEGSPLGLGGKAAGVSQPG
jgi:hypothetical protein